MLLMSGNRGQKPRREEEWDRPVQDGDYGSDARFRDRRGHYDNGRYAP